ncbi:MAG: prolyl oligopeptidase family serine peptidase [Paracoccaceae bacterium]|nr:prolyl oligopeptidase family serine peptidase [Paracoccaceae bacterium]
MRFRLFLFIVVALYPVHLQAAGFERASLPSTPPIDIGIWYPSSSPVPDAANTPFRQALAIDGAIEGKGLPLVLLSHGNGGWMGGHADTALALAEAGYIAVAPTHPGDNGKDESASPTEWLVSRPADMSEAIDYMLSDWTYADRIDPGRIGVFGFSAGGYTALVAAGALPDFSLAARHCADTPEEFTCRIGMLDDVDPAKLEPQLRAVADGARVSAASVAAPGFGYSFDRKALADVTLPVQIWSGAIDDSVPHETNGANIAANLPNTPEVHVVENAGHFAFLVECDPRLKEIKPKIWNRLCVDVDGFDRAAFHKAFNQKIVEFFDAALMQ